MKAITTKYHGPTNTRGARITASDMDGNRVTVSRNLNEDVEQSHAAAAWALCLKMNWHGKLWGGSTKEGMVWVFEDNRRTLEP
jgi:hypothetical protein